AERLPDAVGEEADAGDARDRDDDREREHAQLTGAPVAHEHAQGELHPMRPATRRIWREQRLAMASSCVTRTSVVPRSVFSSNMSCMTPAPVAASRLPVGSSAKSSFGSVTNARASATRCCSPPERCLG